VINKFPKGKDIENGDKFIFNKAFTNALYKIKINQVGKKQELLLRYLVIFVPITGSNGTAV
jgi:hypothetical protein